MLIVELIITASFVIVLMHPARARVWMKDKILAEARICRRSHVSRYPGKNHHRCEVSARVMQSLKTT